MSNQTTTAAQPRSPLPRSIPAAAPSATVLVCRDGTVGSWDAAACEIFGWVPPDVLGLPFCSVFVDEDWDAIDGLWRATPSHPLSVSATARDKAGLALETEVTASRTLAVRGGAAGFIAIVRDVTERRAAEAALSACLGAPDLDSAVAAVRDALMRWVPLTELTLAPDAGGSDALLSVASDGRVFGMLNVGLAEPREVSPRVIRLLAGVAEAVGPSLARLVELEEKSRALGQLEQTDRLEKEFLALITHDMRTPLAVIAGVASYLRDKWDDLPDDERLDELDAILRNGRCLARLVEQDLELGLVDARRLPCEIAPFDIAADLKRIVNDFARVAGARMSLRIDRPLPPVDGDAQRHAQVLGNLLSNAVKFSPPQSLIDVHAFRDSTMVHVSVRDQGCGLSPAQIEKLFCKFARVTPANGARPPGSGLGLYLAKSLVEAQGGRIWVDSRVGEGSTFTYTMPISSVARR